MPFGLGFFAATGGGVRPFAFALNYLNTTNNSFDDIDLDANGNLFIGGPYPSKISSDGLLLACRNAVSGVPAGGGVGAFKVNQYDNTLWVSSNNSASDRGKLIQYDTNLNGYTQYTFTSSRTSVRIYDVDFYSNGDILICGSTYDASSVERGFAARMTPSGSITWVREVWGPTTVALTEVNLMFGCTLDSAERVTLFGVTRQSTTSFMSVITLTAAGAYNARSTYTSSGDFNINNFLASGVKSFFANGFSHLTSESNNTLTLRVPENSTSLSSWSRVVGPGGSGNYTIGRFIGEGTPSTSVRFGLSSTPETTFTATNVSGWSYTTGSSRSYYASIPATGTRNAVAVYVQSKDNSQQLLRYPVGVVLPLTTTALAGSATADVTYTASSSTDVLTSANASSSAITINNGTITLSGSTTSGTLTSLTPNSYLSGVFV